jgi:serine/threonine-protein kinase
MMIEIPPMEPADLDAIAHYKVLQRLGAGGMGVVYLGQDTKLGRKVALKLLPPEFSRDAERLNRFQQEARAISALNHPNILTIYEVGVGEQGHFIATEFVEGETLRQVLRRSRLELPGVLDIAIQASEALAAAHEAGIVHRDIKPENIMLRRDGYLKILDFGLAKPVPEREVRDDAPTFVGTDTSPGVIMGTVNYMSPEQGRGLRVDPRTDIFSLGIVLYEMLAGRLPFEGATSSDTLAAILLREPPPLNTYSPETPAEVQSILARALAKDREDRYPTARELMNDLKALKQRLVVEAELSRSQIRTGSAPAAATVSTPVQPAAPSGAARPLAGSGPLNTTARRRKSKAVDSIAILPLENEGADPNAEYLSDGITESIIDNLGQLPKLRVMARSTVFRYKGRQADPLAIGNELNVRAVLTGRVRQLGDNLVIKAELVDVADGSRLWGEQYRRKFEDIFAVEEEISREISEKLRLRLSGDEKKRLAKRATENSRAYELFLKGRFHWNRRTGEDLQKSIELYQQAIGVDPGYALAHVGLAETLVLMSWFAFVSMPPSESMPRAKASALRALELDPTLAQARVSLALVRLLYDWDWAGAESEFKQAIELNPNYSTARHWYPILLTGAGRFEESLYQIGRALELEPMSLMINSTRGWILHYAGRRQEAVEQFRKTIGMDSGFCAARWLLGYAYEALGHHAEAIAEFREARRLDQTPAILSSLGHALAISGHEDEARAVLEELDRMALRRYVSPESQALVYLGLKECDRAMDWLERAFEDRSSYLILINVDPRLAPLRTDPRFTRLLKTIGFRS